MKRLFFNPREVLSEMRPLFLILLGGMLMFICQSISLRYDARMRETWITILERYEEEASVRRLEATRNDVSPRQAER